jgi:hypothetical protein
VAAQRGNISSIQIMSEALGTATEFAIRDGAAGTVLWRGILVSGAAGDRTITFPNPLVGTVNTLMEFVTLTATGASGAVYVNAHGYVSQQ